MVLPDVLALPVEEAAPVFESAGFVVRTTITMAPRPMSGQGESRRVVRQRLLEEDTVELVLGSAATYLGTASGPV